MVADDDIDEVLSNNGSTMSETADCMPISKTTGNDNNGKCLGQYMKRDNI